MSHIICLTLECIERLWRVKLDLLLKTPLHEGHANVLQSLDVNTFLHAVEITYWEL